MHLGQEGITTATVDFSDSSLWPNTVLVIDYNGSSYESRLGRGSMTRTINGNTATVTFNAVLHETNTFSDGIVVTNGHYSGDFKLDQ